MASPPTSPTHSDSSCYNGTMCSHSVSVKSSIQNAVRCNLNSLVLFGNFVPLPTFFLSQEAPVNCGILPLPVRDHFHAVLRCSALKSFGTGLTSLSHRTKTPLTSNNSWRLSSIEKGTIASCSDWQWWKHDTWVDALIFALFPGRCYDMR